MPFDSPYPARGLHYPLDRAVQTHADTPLGETVNIFTWPTPDPDERVRITHELSLNEYVGLATCVDVGSDIAFAEDAVKLWWIWVRSVNTVDFCTQVAECIASNVVTQQAVINMLNQSGAINPNKIDPSTPQMNNRFPQTQRGQQIIPPPADCNLDELWGGIREGIVKYLDDTARNFLEDVVAQADKGERAASIISAIPLVGDLAASLITQFVELAPDLLNLFNAYSSESALDTAACGLFELVCAQCRYPTYDEVFSYFASAGISGLDDIANLTWTAITDLLFGSSNLAALVCWHTIVAYELFTLYLGGTFLGRQGTKTLQIWADIGDELPSDNWELLCDACVPTGWGYEIDFTAELGLWTVLHGTHVPGVGIVSETVNNKASAAVYLTADAAYQWTRWAIQENRLAAGGFEDDLRIIVWTDINAGTGRIDWIEYNQTQTGTFEVCELEPPVVARKQISFFLRDNTPTNTVTIKKIKVFNVDESSPPAPLLNNTSSDCTL